MPTAREYDPVADFPRNPFNLLALANSLAAFRYVHWSYDEADVDDPDNIVWKEGKAYNRTWLEGKEPQGEAAH